MTTGTSVSLDTTELSAALKQMAEAQMAEQLAKMQAQPQTINPVAVIAETSARMAELYDRYAKLQEIGRILNGVSLSDPIPENLQIDDITVVFRTKDSAATTGYSDYKTASIKNVICAGDIYKLLSGEMGVLILTLEQEMKSLHDIAGKSEAQYEKARQQWETANPDRQIKPILAEELAPKS